MFISGGTRSGKIAEPPSDENPSQRSLRPCARSLIGVTPARSGSRSMTLRPARTVAMTDGGNEAGATAYDRAKYRESINGFEPAINPPVAPNTLLNVPTVISTPRSTLKCSAAPRPVGPITPVPCASSRIRIAPFLPGIFGQRVQRREIAIHRIHSLDADEPVAGDVLAALQHPIERVEIVVRKLHSAHSRHFQSIGKRGMAVRIVEYCIAGTHKRAHQSDVRAVSCGENHWHLRRDLNCASRSSSSRWSAV